MPNTLSNRNNKLLRHEKHHSDESTLKIQISLKNVAKKWNAKANEKSKLFYFLYVLMIK